jgi:phosphoserine aminotransferase
MKAKINFNAGPSAMPPEVLHEAEKSIHKYKKSGLSILELPHRSNDFIEIIEESKALVRELCGLKKDYEVLWLQGGGRMQFCMIPMNFMKKSAGYIDSGHWSREAMEYAGHYGKVETLSSSRDNDYTALPEWPASIPDSLSYAHMCTNNTIIGTQWHNIPKTDVPLIADMSSDIFGRKVDYNNFSMFYAAVQKNLGTPGLALAVIKKELLDSSNGKLPPMLDYKAHAKENSILNTANVFGIYVALLMLRWTKEQGVANLEKINKQKAQLLYDAIDSSSTFNAVVKDKKHRSLMNVVFTANTTENEKAFLDICAKHNIIGIQGHRSIGGFRASLYNAVSLDSAAELARMIKDFDAHASKKQ